MISIVAFIFIMAVTQESNNSLIRSLQNFVFMIILSFANLVMRVIFSPEKKTKEKYLKLKFYLSSYLITIVIWLLVKDLYTWITGVKWEGEGPHVYQAYSLAIFSIWILNTLIIFLQDLVILQHNKAQAEIENLQLKASVSETANLLLRQQIHPHFLFNSLNTVKSLYKRDIQEGENYLVHLANFLRAAISNDSNKTILIKDEVTLCIDYLEMQKIRFGSALNYTINISDDARQKKYLPYFSLQPLLENALKHNDLTEESPLFLHVKEEGEYLVVTNNIQHRNFVEISTGVGLANLSERYRLLAGEEIIIKPETNLFKVYIKKLNK